MVLHVSSLGTSIRALFITPERRDLSNKNCSRTHRIKLIDATNKSHRIVSSEK